jgi:hypothetical protein
MWKNLNPIPEQKFILENSWHSLSKSMKKANSIFKNIFLKTDPKFHESKISPELRKKNAQLVYKRDINNRFFYFQKKYSKQDDHVEYWTYFCEESLQIYQFFYPISYHDTSIYCSVLIENQIQLGFVFKVVLMFLF